MLSEVDAGWEVAVRLAEAGSRGKFRMPGATCSGEDVPADGPGRPYEGIHGSHTGSAAHLGGERLSGRDWIDVRIREGIDPTQSLPYRAGVRTMAADWTDLPFETGTSRPGLREVRQRTNDYGRRPDVQLITTVIGSALAFS